MQYKRFLILSAVGVSSIPFAAAGPGIVSNIWNKILYLGGLGFILPAEAGVIAFTRLLIWLLVFTVFFAVITGLGGRSGTAPMKFFGRGQAGIIAAILATIAAVFLPAEVLLATGAGWGTAIALLLIGGPVVGLGYLLLTIPGKGKETKGTVLIKLILCLLLLWILTAVKYHVGRIA